MRRQAPVIAIAAKHAAMCKGIVTTPNIESIFRHKIALVLIIAPSSSAETVYMIAVIVLYPFGNIGCNISVVWIIVPSGNTSVFKVAAP